MPEKTVFFFFVFIMVYVSFAKSNLQFSQDQYYEYEQNDKNCLQKKKETQGKNKN